MPAAADVALVIVTGRGKLAPRRGFANAVPHPSTGRPLAHAGGRPSSSSSLPGSAAQQLPPHVGQHVGNLSSINLCASSMPVSSSTFPALPPQPS